MFCFSEEDSIKRQGFKTYGHLVFACKLCESSSASRIEKKGKMINSMVLCSLLICQVMSFAKTCYSVDSNSRLLWNKRYTCQIFNNRRPKKKKKKWWLDFTFPHCYHTTWERAQFKLLKKQSLLVTSLDRYKNLCWNSNLS